MSVRKKIRKPAKDKKVEKSNAKYSEDRFIERGSLFYEYRQKSRWPGLLGTAGKGYEL